MKKILQSLLLLFAVGAIVYYAWGRIAEKSNAPEAQIATAPQTEAADQAITTSEAATEEPTIVVTYFTTDVRCVSCKTIEALTRATVEEKFPEAVASGRLRFQTLNLDRAENKHFARDYDMAFKTVVVSQEADGEVLRWEKRDDVWKLFNQPAQFKAYVAAPVREFLDHSS